MDYNTVKILAISEACGFLDSPKIERRYWVHPSNTERERCGRFKTFYNNIRNNPETFFEYYRMTVPSFDELLKLVRAHITKQHTNWRNPISTEERLTITIRFLSLGTSFAAIQHEFNVGRSTVSNIIKETCQAIWTVLQKLEMSDPTLERWKEISNEFYSKTNFPNCIGAVDGKHIRCMNPKSAGSLFFNHKKYFSVILMAVVDSDCCFINIDVGREGDSNVFKKSPLGRKIYSNHLNVPEPICLPNTFESPQPFVLVADKAFPLLPNLLRPYPDRVLTEKRRVFNCRLSRARRLAECAFGILSNKWHIFHGAILVEPDFVDDIVKACCVLHNFVRRRDGVNFEDTLYSHMDDMKVTRTGSRSEGRRVRDFFTNYFMTNVGLHVLNIPNKN